jgi:hypothetical protein
VDDVRPVHDESPSPTSVNETMDTAKPAIHGITTFQPVTKVNKVTIPEPAPRYSLRSRQAIYYKE